MTDTIKTVIDTVATILAGLTLMKLVPILLALPSFVWSCIRIYEWLKGRKSNGD